jgi:hypothetical protein
MIGGEINLKGIALCLLTFKYYATSLETPEQIRLPNGLLRVQLSNSQRSAQKLEKWIAVAQWTSIIIFILNWVLISVA